MFWPGTSEADVILSLQDQIIKVSRCFLSLSLILCFLVLNAPAFSVENGAHHPSAKEYSEVENSAIESNGSGVIFEEPITTSKPSEVSLPEPDDCLEQGIQDVLPRIAIIIDDMGHHRKLGGELLDLDLNLTYSFLPHAPFTIEQEERAWKMGRDILVHMPMEPQDASFDPGPDSLNLADPVETMVQNVVKNINGVPHAIGMNNHMGSRFTADRDAMREVLKVLQEKDLFYVDSLTTSQSTGAEEASKLGIKTGQRIVFLDNSQTQEDICRQLKRLVAYAKKRGSGIGIGHPNRATLNALKLCRDLLLKQVRVVGVHELVK